MLQAKADAEPVQQIDVTYQHGQVDNLLVREVSFQGSEHVIRGAVDAEPCQSLRPGERSTLALRINGRLAPRRKQVQALRRLAEATGILGVLVDAECALVYLRGPELHQIDQPFIQIAFLDVALNGHHGLSSRRRNLRVAKTCLEHACSSRVQGGSALT